MPQKVYFGKLPRDARERDLERLVEKYGRFRDVRILQGFGFVEFDDYRDADDVVKDLDGRDFMGERIIVELAKERRRDRDDRGRRDDRRDRRDDRRDRRDYDRPRRRSPTRNNALRVVINGLPSRSTWQDLKDLMRKAGEVQYTNVDRGEGIVEFINQEGMDKALDMFQNYDYDGNVLTIKPFEKNGNETHQNGHSRDESHRSTEDDGPASRTRSRSRSPRRLHDNEEDRARSLERSPNPDDRD